MKETKDVTALVVDNGIFVHVARRLAREYKQVYYWSPADRAFPICQERCVGDGYDDIKRVESIWDVVESCDLAVFPDIGHSALQNHLVRNGIPVWGARNGDELETNRGKFLNILESTGLPVPDYEKVSGLTNLRMVLKDREDCYIKVSKLRGDFETFHWRSWKQDECELDAYAVRFGPLRDHVSFYVFEPIDAKIEDGVDAYCIDGRWPDTIIHGMECKDKAYLGTFQKFADLPDEVRVVNEKFSPILEDYGYRSRFSTEVRITDSGKSYFIDPTCRFGSPPSQCEMEMVKNWGEIIWGGANGDLVEMEQAAKFGVQAICKIDRSSWQVLDLNEDLDQWVKISFSCKVDGCVCVPPDGEGPSEIGWVTAIGETIKEAIANLNATVEDLPDGMCCETNHFSELIEEVNSAEEAGMEFTDQKIPDPKSVV